MLYSTIVDKRPQAPILVIDDNTDHWFIIRWALLQRFPESAPVWAAESAQAVTYLETCSEIDQPLPQLILLDLYLPQRNIGWNLLEILKNHDVYKQIPVVVMSYSNYPDDIKGSYQLDCDSYVVKPANYPDWLTCFDQLKNYW